MLRRGVSTTNGAKGTAWRPAAAAPRHPAASFVQRAEAGAAWHGSKPAAAGAAAAPLPRLHRPALPRRRRVAAAGGEPIAATSDAVPGVGPAAEGLPPDAARSVLMDARAFLETELQRLFTPGGEVTRSRYALNLHFQDPITRLDSLDAYVLMVRALKTIFNITFDLHTLEITGPDEISARWTMTVDVWPLPWRPTAVFTGRSKYQVRIPPRAVDTDSGLITSHRDTWDSLDNNAFPSVEAVAQLMRQALDLTQVPKDLETPKYTVLKAARDYEVRRYEPFLVADAPMGSGSSPSGGAGFNELARYIFGGNTAKQKMEMTTPVFSDRTEDGGRMSFVMEQKFTDPESLPAPLDPKVKPRRVGPQIVAAARFPGWALDWEVAGAERDLRAALLRDGLRPEPGFQLARYNDPLTPPPLRRNEVLVKLEDFEGW